MIDTEPMWTLSLGKWSIEWSNYLGPYMILARCLDDVYDQVKAVFNAWHSVKLPGRDGIVPETKQGEVGKTSKVGPGFAVTKAGNRVPVHYVKGTKGEGYFVTIYDPDVRAWKPMASLGRRERLQMLSDMMRGIVVLTPKQSKSAKHSGKHSTETYVEMVKKQRAMLRMFHYHIFNADHRKQPCDWKEPSFMDLKEIMTKYSENQAQAARMFEERKRDMMAVKTGEDMPYIRPGDENSKYYTKPDEPPISHPADVLARLQDEKPDAPIEELVKEADEIVAKEFADRTEKRKAEAEAEARVIAETKAHLDALAASASD
jgi:hypothetical protein